MSNLNNEKRQNTTNINWYPAHMKKTKEEIKKNSVLIDFVLELLDARIPYSSKVVGIDELIKGKPRLIVMTKMDLADEVETGKWVSYYENIGYKVVGVNLKGANAHKKILAAIDEFAKDINAKRKTKGLKEKHIRGLVIGIPNVGKSTLINKISGRNAVGVGNTPGFTKHLSWIKAGNVELLDSPGILWPKFESAEVALNLAAMSAIKAEILPLDEVAMHILHKLKDFYPEILSSRYEMENLDDIEEVYETIGRRLGIISKGGEVDYDKVNLFIVSDIKQERVKGITFDRR